MREISGSFEGGFSRCFILLLYSLGSRRIDLGSASVRGVEPSRDGGTSGSVAEKPWGKNDFLGDRVDLCG